MSESLFSPSWYRVADLRPRLRGHAQVHRHSYRDEVWYVLQDHMSGKYHRFSEGANQVIGLMDGHRSVDEIWQRAAEELGDDSPTQEEMIRLLGQLHAADLLQSETPPDTVELFSRYRKQESAKLKQKMSSPLAIRFRLFDPERFLSRYLWLVRPLFSTAGFLLWLGTVLAAVVLAAMHWSELTSDVADRVLAPQNLLLLWLVYPLVKTVHELGHAFATKMWGGEVHEIGLMLLVFMPVPYVDASASSAFRERHRRVVVGAIGIMVEMFLAAIALFVWLNAEYGTVRAIAYNVMLIGGISTVFFNGNPLLRYDGYYVLADAVEMPNLAKRSQNYLGYLAKRYLFGMADEESPAHNASDRRWFFGYGFLSVIYRVFIAVAIILFVAGEFFFIGLLLAAWAAFTMLFMPIFKTAKYLLLDQKLKEKRPRALMVSSGLIGVLAVLLFLVPAPYRTMAEGVVWLPEKASVRAGTSCLIRDYVSRPDAMVKAGDALILCEDPLLRSREENYMARHQELKYLYSAQWRDNRVAARITGEELKAVEADLRDVRERIEALVIKSPMDGLFVVPRARDLPGRFVQQGAILGYVVEQAPMTVRVAVPEDDAELVHSSTSAVRVQLADRLGESISADITRKVPGGTNTLPSAVLGKQGGGEIDVDPRDSSNKTTITRIFEYDLALPAQVRRAPVGTRVFVQFDHGTQPLAYQIFRRARQVFLGRFGA